MPEILPLEARLNPQFDLELRPHHVENFARHEAAPAWYEMSDAEYVSNFRQGLRQFVIGHMRDVNAQRQREGLSQYSKDEIRQWSESAANYHSDRLVLHWRATLKRLHDNPDLRFKYVVDLDTACKGCESKEACSTQTTWQYVNAMAADRDAMTKLPELVPGQVYDGHHVRKLFQQKGWINHQQ